VTEPAIRRMTAADVAAASEMISREWNDRTVFLRWALEYSPSHLFVADDAGRIVGTGIASAHGPVGWVGTIFVARDRRQEGLGGLLTRTVIDDLESRGCRTLVLIATDAGRPLYERLGFEVQVSQARFTAPGLPPAEIDDGIQPFEPRMLPELVALDRSATAEDRSVLIERLADGATTRVVVGDDRFVRAFVIRSPWGGVSLIAPNPADGLRLLEWRRRQAEPGHAVYAGLPDSDDDRRALLLSNGWTPAGAGTRMLRGEPLAWHPDWIWGSFNGALG
jgi:predicted N-acetyltransferase YhbS